MATVTIDRQEELCDNSEFDWDNAWKYALTLHERMNATGEVSAEKIAECYKQWLQQSPFNGGFSLDKRLEAEGITKADFDVALGLLVDSIHESEKPSWACRVEKYLSESVPNDSSFDSIATNIGLAAIAYPMIADSRKLLVESLAEPLSQLPHGFTEASAIAEMLLPALLERVMQIAGRTMILELNVARVAEMLQGETPEARFAEFVAQITEPSRRAEILGEYPVIAREILRACDRWRESIVEMIQRLAQDWTSIGDRLFAGSPPDKLKDITIGAGDTHRGGRTVAIFSFTDGRKLVYKPRSLAADAAFQQLLAWCDDKGFKAPIRKLRLVDRDKYGWAEFLPAEECLDADGVKRFFYRQGALLALVHVLYGNDIHEENLIAAGEHPVLIDLETLLVAPFPESPNESVDQTVSRFAGWSVTRVGLLPTARLDGGLDGVDLSGLGSSEDQWTPHPMLVCENDGTDEMRLNRRKVKLKGSNNVPKISGQRASAGDFHDTILAGFRDIYHLLIEHREELLSRAEPIQAFADAEVRVVLRGTQVYGRMLQESYHPDLLRDALNRDRFFEFLWTDAIFRPEMSRVVPAERNEILTGDVPVFFAKASSRDLVSGAGERIENFFDISGLDAVRKRIEELSDRDLHQQEWFIKSSLGGPVSSPIKFNSASSTRFAESSFLSVADRIGDRLLRSAFRRGNQANWLGLTVGSSKSASAMPLGLDLYAGMPGVALFLAELANATGESCYRELAESCVASILRQIGEGAPIGIGGMSGWGGVAYSFARLGKLWDRNDLFGKALEIVRRMALAVSDDQSLDIIGGSAGAIACFLSLHRVQPSDEVLSAAFRCGEHLLSTAVPQRKGVGWVMPSIASQPLSGFSHGAAGFAWSLGQLHRISNDQRFRNAAMQAIDYERSTYDASVGNWLDLRTPEPGVNQQQTAMAWCHGAPGIGLGRAKMLEFADDISIRREIATAAKTTLSDSFEGGHSLCHGSLGNLDCLITMATSLKHEGLLEAALNCARRVLMAGEQNGWSFGSMSNLEVPGLMTGLAGIGYAMLRFSNPHKVPSVLAFEI